MALTYATPQRLAQRRVVVTLVGVGATGSWLLPQLVRIDRTLLLLGHPEGLAVDVWDGDTVSEANVGRGSFLPQHVGRNKATCLVHQTNQAWGTAWRALPKHLSPERAPRELAATDILLSCTDSAAWRVGIGKTFRGRPLNTLWLDCGNSERTGQVVLGHLGKPAGKEIKLPNIYDLYEEDLKHAVREDTGPSCSLAAAIARQDLTVNLEMAARAAQLLWNLLRHGGLDAHAVFSDTAALRATPLPIAPESWAWMGSSAKKRKAA